MKTPAIVSTLTVVGSLAFAAGQSGVIKPPPETPAAEPEQPRRDCLPLRLAAASSCPPGDRLHWFSPVPHVIECPGINGTTWLIGDPGARQDVNADGVPEYIQSAPVPYSGVITSGAPRVLPDEECDVKVSRVQAGTGLPMWDPVRVIPQDFGAWFKDRYPNCTSAQIFFANWGFEANNWAGWRDVDGDGDLDYVTLVMHSDGTSGSYVSVWFENIGFEKPTPPLAADLNHDGNVDGIDLGLLLASWGAQS